MLLAMSLFIVAMFLLADTKIEYALIAIVTACALVLSSCLIEKEEENINLKTQLRDHALRGNELLRQRTIAENIANRYESENDTLRGNLRRADDILERYSQEDDMIRHHVVAFKLKKDFFPQA